MTALVTEATLAGTGHMVEFRALPVRSVLNRSSSRRGLSLAYSINPYRGCEFGCKYCYARYTHEFLEPSHGNATSGSSHDAFEHRIFLKQNAAWLLEQELRKITPGEEIAIGTATDPYQPVERSALVTRSILEVFARRNGHRIGIVTKSALIARDIGLLREVAARNQLVIHLTITTSDAGLARVLEPRAPRPDLRLKTVGRLREAGLTAGILCSPLLPGITDSAAAIEGMAAHAAAAKASFFAAEPLFLKPCSRPTYLSFLREHFPDLVADTAARFADADFAAPAYREHLRSLVQASCRRHGLVQRSTDALLTRDAGSSSKPPSSVSSRRQLALFA